jgi:hypothetical protein
MSASPHPDLFVACPSIVVSAGAAAVSRSASDVVVARTNDKSSGIMKVI